MCAGHKWKYPPIFHVCRAHMKIPPQSKGVLRGPQYNFSSVHILTYGPQPTICSVQSLAWNGVWKTVFFNFRSSGLIFQKTKTGHFPENRSLTFPPKRVIWSNQQEPGNWEVKFRGWNQFFLNLLDSRRLIGKRKRVTFPNLDSIRETINRIWQS